MKRSIPVSDKHQFSSNQPASSSDSTEPHANLTSQQRLQRHLLDKLVEVRLQLQLDESRQRQLTQTRDELLHQLTILNRALDRRHQLQSQNSQMIIEELQVIGNRLEKAEADLLEVTDRLLDTTPNVEGSASLATLYRNIQSRRPIPNSACPEHLQLLREVLLVRYGEGDRAIGVDTRPDLDPADLLHHVTQKILNNNSSDGDGGSEKMLEESRVSEE